MTRLARRCAGLRPVLMLLTGLGAVAAAAAASLSGDYVATGDPAVALTLAESPAGAVTGTLRDAGTALAFSGRRDATGFTGRVQSGGQSVPLVAVLRGADLVFTMGAGDDAERVTFRRAGTAAAQAGAATPAAAPAGRKVVINGTRLGDAELARLEGAYHVHIDDAEYWYDRVLGAWGVRAGPTRGFIAPGLDLGGPLRADASGGGTRVFVNGRELHAADVRALQQLTGPIRPGRYFITAEGLAGFEGGPPQWNLLQMAQPAGGGSGTWQSRLTGASGFSDGTTGAVFLPNGGIVSTGN